MKQKILWISLIVIVLLLAAFYLSKKLPAPASKMSKEQTLDSIRETITKDINCPSALTELAKLIKANPSYAEAWQWQGACQFQTGDMASAKTSFDKALALDPELVASKNYLKIINSGAKPTLSDAKSQSDFESQLGFVPDPQILKFEQLSTQKNAISATTTLEFSMALYASYKTFSETQTYFEKTLKNLQGVIFKSVKSEKAITFNAFTKDGKKTITISINQSSPVKVYITSANKQ